MKGHTGIRQMLVDIVQDCVAQTSIEEGIVKSATPLELSLTNDKKMKLTETDVIVPSRLDGELQTGEQLHLLVINNGKQYYVLDKA